MLNTTTGTLNLKDEAILDPSIQFKNPVSESLLQPKSILLTGATGFLGAFLLDELLHKTTADIYCLIRCIHTEDGKNRLQKHLDFYDLWEESFSSRIIPVVGDLSQPLLGLSQQEFNQLGRIIDIIYHNGAWVNSARPYSTLKPANVLGTQEILRLASLFQTKPIHFTSTIGVFPSQPDLLAEKIAETDIPEFSNLKGGYRQSKWVAEQLIRIAQQRGLSACIYRPSRIIGHSKTGINGNFQDFLCILLKACIQLGKIPDLNTQINIVPVDYVSQAIVALSQKQNYSGQAFHLINPESIPWESFFNSISALGYALKKVTYHEFLAEIKYQFSLHPKDKLYSSLFLLLSSSKIFTPDKQEFDLQQTLEALTDTLIVCPPVNEELLTLYFSYFQKVSYFPTLLAQFKT